jgi:uncharacterized protein YggE
MKATYICLLILASAAPAWGADLPEFPFINVTGFATRAVAPDLAKVSFNVKARDVSADTAASTVAARTQEVLDLLAANGVAPTDIDAHEIGKAALFERDSGDSAKPSRAALLRYEVTRSFLVTIHKLAAWPAIGTKLLGIQNVEDLDARFDCNDHKAQEAELLAAAAHNARERAEIMAAGFAQHLGAVQAISQEPFEQISGRLLRADMHYGYGPQSSASFKVSAGQISAAQLLVPATIPLAQVVNAIYRLESASH